MAKGGQYERDLCKKLSIWWSNGEHEDLFWRTSGSGSRATVRGRKGKNTRNHCGDICNTDLIGQPLISVCCFESKRGYSRSTISDLLDCPTNSKQQLYEEWFEKAERSRQNSGSFSWVLIHKRDYREPIIFLQGNLWDKLRERLIEFDLPYFHIFVNRRKETGGFVREHIVGTHFDNFLNKVKPEYIVQIQNEVNSNGEMSQLSKGSPSIQ